MTYIGKFVSFHIHDRAAEIYNLNLQEALVALITHASSWDGAGASRCAPLAALWIAHEPSFRVYWEATKRTVGAPCTMKGRGHYVFNTALKIQLGQTSTTMWHPCNHQTPRAPYVAKVGNEWFGQPESKRVEFIAWANQQLGVSGINGKALPVATVSHD